MADTVTIEVSGLKTIDAALRELPRAVQDEILGEALKACGEVLKDDIAVRIHERTGKTSADLRVQVQVAPGQVAGEARVGAQAGKTGRGYILNFLERGTKPHVIPKKRRDQTRKVKALAYGGKVFARVKHPGTRAQAPMRIALAQSGEKAIAAFGRRAWEGIVAAVGKKTA